MPRQERPWFLTKVRCRGADGVFAKLWQWGYQAVGPKGNRHRIDAIGKPSK